MKKTLYRPVLLNTALIICFTFSLYGLAIDLPLIAEAKRFLYIEGRIFSALMCLFFLSEVNVLKRQYESQVPLIYSVIILYCAQGQYFVNGYYLAFMQAIAGFSLFFAMPKKFYYPITFFGNVLMLFAIWNSEYHYSELPEKNFKFNVDTSLGVVLISLICLIGYLTMTLTRERKQILSEKFLDIGRYFGNFVHEMKGMISAPSVYVEMLSKELSKPNPDLSLIREVVSNLENDLSNMNQKVLSLNSLSKNSREIVPVDIKALVGKIERHFLANDNLRIEILGGTSTILGNEHSIRAILFNLINNSRENFLTVGRIHKSIQLLISPQKIIFKDNGGGFSKAALKNVNRNSFFSEKEQGSGMGLFMVKEYMKEFGGFAVFKNRSDGIDGVELELNFDKSIEP